jgi:uncharacterized sporulation protein YeaH/YhbH (DUF444 family)
MERKSLRKNYESEEKQFMKLNKKEKKHLKQTNMWQSTPKNVDSVRSRIPFFPFVLRFYGWKKKQLDENVVGWTRRKT